MMALPHGLKHLQDSLFREAPSPSAQSQGVSLLAASGEVGEARLVARQIRSWLTAGVPAQDIIVTMRNLESQEALLREVFEEYAVPAIWPKTLPLANCGALALLRRCWLLPEREFAFREVAAIWRNTYFLPQFEADLPLKAEMLLRQLNVPRDRDAYLRSLGLWSAEIPPLPLDDETMDRSRREERSKLAKRCTGFVQWFFNLWEAIPASANPKAMVALFRKMAAELGVDRAPLPLDQDAEALQAFWETLEGRAAAAKRGTVTPGEFARVLNDIITNTPWPQQTPAEGVRILPADAVVPCSHLIIMGLGEGSYPRLGVNPESFETELAREQAAFRNLIAQAGREVVFSYAALDAKGQAMLPSTFLVAVRKCFQTIETKSQIMLLDGYFSDPPISAAEVRTQYARSLADGKPVAAQPSANVVKQLRTAQVMAAARFRSSVPTPYSGGLTSAANVAIIARRFGPTKVFSPTSLETYIGCPFRFWLEKVLGIQELEEPSEDVEVSRRGSAMHRALSTFHRLKPQERPEKIPAELAANWGTAVQEEVNRTPSAVGRVLWSLEQRRVQRSLKRYPDHWEAFRSGWAQQGATPQPQEFEVMFGFDNPVCRKPAMILKSDDVEVRIGGVIDRVDLASLDEGLGFWIIDYKTGSALSFSTSDLLAFEKLQLPLYALAVERVFFPTSTVRPLGLAYWLVVKKGPKRMLPEGRDEYLWAQETEEWITYREELERVVLRVASQLRSGDFRLAPRRDSTCEYCPFHAVCRIGQQRDRLTPLALVSGDTA